MKYTFAVACLGLAFASCSPKIVVRSTQAAAPVAVHEGFLVVKETETFAAPAQEVGDIQIRDAGLTLDCDYDKVVELAAEKARQMGANVLRIYDHRLPSLYGSSCHRIRAKALRIADITPYEKEIIWHPARRLKQADFKGSTDNRPFAAATSSNIRYHYAGTPLQGTVQFTIETYFDCQESYFKPTSQAAYTLAHEQVHFDITELYSRRLAKALQEQVANTQELERKQQEIYRQLISEAQLLQDKYDSEVYADNDKLPAWQTKIAQDLTALEPYAAKQFTIKFKL
ncbi:hypothetical protein [Hymenobacter glacieicola]|uniref:DUF922 domain-containing protein n=1 Tax=Hymenobacter glacieicola TaxID=1562124 RepID=A0ABQ1WEL2_9BACT|nr:hypothetical protein [Hymenobacter glacieicola]GGG27262.1 hypothetical protein GCM10011378_00070 [Hymenobacter glacieicola]